MQFGEGRTPYTSRNTLLKNWNNSSATIKRNWTFLTGRNFGSHIQICYQTSICGQWSDIPIHSRQPACKHHIKLHLFHSHCFLSVQVMKPFSMNGWRTGRLLTTEVKFSYCSLRHSVKHIFIITWSFEVRRAVVNGITGGSRFANLTIAALQITYFFFLLLVWTAAALSIYFCVGFGSFPVLTVRSPVRA